MARQIHRNPVRLLMIQRRKYAFSRGHCAGGDCIWKDIPQPSSRRVDASQPGAYRSPGADTVAVLAKWTGNDWIVLTNFVGRYHRFVHSLISVGSDLDVGGQNVTPPDGANRIGLTNPFYRLREAGP